MALETGRIYTGEERESMILFGWLNENGKNVKYEDTKVSDYFDADGRYLGPDMFGIYPDIF